MDKTIQGEKNNVTNSISNIIEEFYLYAYYMKRTTSFSLYKKALKYIENEKFLTSCFF